MKKQLSRSIKNTDKQKASDSDNSEIEITEAEEEMFTQEDFEDALKRVSRPICEPIEESS